MVSLTPTRESARAGAGTQRSSSWPFSTLSLKRGKQDPKFYTKTWSWGPKGNEGEGGRLGQSGSCHSVQNRPAAGCLIQNQSHTLQRPRRPWSHTAFILVMSSKDCIRLQPRPIKTDSGVRPRHLFQNLQGEHNVLWEPLLSCLTSLPRHLQQALVPHLSPHAPPLSLCSCHRHPCGSSNMPSVLQIGAFALPSTFFLPFFLVIRSFHSEILHKTGCIFPLPIGRPFAICPIKRQSLFLCLFKQGWPFDLLSTIKCGRSKVW